jgi:hypothetical protein
MTLRNSDRCARKPCRLLKPVALEAGGEINAGLDAKAIQKFAD